VTSQPDLTETRSSWERTKQKHEQALARALKQEQERKELEELRQQAVRAKYRSLYPSIAEALPPKPAPARRRPVEALSPGRHPADRRRNRAFRAEQRPELYEDEAPTPTGPATDDPAEGSELDEVAVVNGAGPEDFEELMQSLAERPLHEIQRVLTARFKLVDGGGKAASASAPRGKASASASTKPSEASMRRTGSFQSCIDAYSSPVGPKALLKPDKQPVGVKRRRSRALSDPLGAKPDAKSRGGGGDGMDDAWKRLFYSGSRGAVVSRRVERNLDNIYSSGLDALKAAFQGDDDAVNDFLAARDEPSADEQEGEGVETDGVDMGPLGADETSMNASLTDDEVTRLINQFDIPGLGMSSRQPAPESTASVDLDAVTSSLERPALALEEAGAAGGGVSREYSSQIRRRRADATTVVMGSLQPYQRYEQGFTHQFFDPTSTTDKGRFRVHDAQDFLVSLLPPCGAR
jgi:hypothetical protein